MSPKVVPITTPPEPETEIDLQVLADEAVATGIHDLDDVVNYIDFRVPDRDLRAVFRQALRQTAVQALNRPRTAVQKAARAPGATQPSYAAGRPGQGSQKWDKATSLYRQWLLSDLAVPGGGVERHKSLGECTVIDCLAVAGHRAKMSRTLAGEARRFEMLAERLEQHKVRTVAELPERVATKVMTWTPPT